MLRTGQTAPDFALPGVEGGEPSVYELFRAIEAGDAVLLWFVPTPFLPTATAELSAIRTAGWHELSGLRVWVCSMDSIHAAAAHADRHGLSMAFLGDAGGVAETYGVRHDEWEGHYGVPKRAAFLVEPDWTIAFAWATDDAFEAVDPSPVARVDAEIQSRFPNAEAAPSVEYTS